MVYLNENSWVVDGSGEVIAREIYYFPMKIKTKRICFSCYKDLTGETGCYVFINGSVNVSNPRYIVTDQPEIYEVLLCVSHGANGRNNVYSWEFAEMVANLPKER